MLKSILIEGLHATVKTTSTTMLVNLNTRVFGLVVFCITLTATLISVLIGRNVIAQGILTIATIYLITGKRPSLVYAIIRSLPRDSKAIYRFVWMNFTLRRWERKGETVYSVFQNNLKYYGNKVALMLNDSKLTFNEVENLSNKVANFFKSKGYKRGETIALLMDNQPEYPCMWLGLGKLGIVTALINTNLRKTGLVHCIRVANAKAIIVSSELYAAISEVLDDEYIKTLKVFVYHNDESKVTEGVNLNESLANQSTEPPVQEMREGKTKDKLLYIFTSGTTGMPKAAVITHMRYMFMAVACRTLIGIYETDIIYNPLPMYHTAGGIVGLGNVLLFGSAMGLRKKFSASNFWTDCIKYKCTAAQYIGEICRYLLSTPSKPTDTEHKVRIMFGNGLRPQIWKEFVNRFNVPNIGEVYGSTEGNSNLANIDSTVGAVGFVPRFAKHVYPVTLVKCDESSGEPIRNEDGFCTRCDPGEPGVFLGKINPKKAVIAFEGYADKKASEKKILHDVYKKGDAYFNSGDVLVMDLLGYFYFKDRTGDTFRWRGENVSTSEVEAVISNIIGLQDCIVYGVNIPHIEGKAGMAAIVNTSGKFDIEQLSGGIKSTLPPYSRPLFIRLLKELPMTGTFKLKKLDLQNEGYDLNVVKDVIYFLNSDGIYREFTQENYQAILEGKARL